MLGRLDILDALLRECEITKHLLTKVPSGGMDYRPTPDQRTALELARYQSFCGLGGSYALVDGNWDRYRELSEASEKVESGGLAAAIDAQAAALKAFFEDLSDDDFASKEVTTPMGETMPLGRALLEMPVKWMTAYRMQLYLYCKGAGNTDIWTPNCWAGIDMERPTQSA